MSLHQILLYAHSILRWVVLIVLVIAIFRGLSGWLGHKPCRRGDNSIRNQAASLVHLQLLVGLILYFISPGIEAFRNNIKAAMKDPEARFYGLEHTVMMLIAIIIITIGSSRAKRARSDNQKFKTMSMWFLIGLVIILISIPWPGTWGAGRPLLRY